MNFRDLKRRVSIVSVLENKGLLCGLRKRGVDLVGPCPVHKGDNPGAFVVSLKKNLWHCFTRCRGGGDVIELVRRLDRISYHQTARYLDWLEQTGVTAEMRPENRLKSSQPFKQVNQHCFRPFTAALKLQHNISFLRNKGIEPATATFFEAGAYAHRGMLSGCIAVRLHDIRGQPIGYAGRRLDPSLKNRYGKWVFPKGLPKKEILYNFHRIKQKSPHPLVVVESPWGVMRLAQLKIPAVALLGINLFGLHLKLLKKRSKIVLMLDGDQAGRSATERIKNLLQPLSDISVVLLPKELDPDDLDDTSIIKLLKTSLFD